MKLQQKDPVVVNALSYNCFNKVCVSVSCELYESMEPQDVNEKIAQV